MGRRNWRKFATTAVLIWLLVFLATACGGSSTPEAPIPEVTPDATRTAPTATLDQPQATEETLPVEAECEHPAEEISAGTPVQSELSGQDQPPPERKYFCVFIPTGVTNLAFELTETDSVLNMFVGHPDLRTVQEGGVWFWFSDEIEEGDKVIVVEPALEDHVKTGLYYIEVSPDDFRQSSHFTLLVSIR